MKARQLAGAIGEAGLPSPGSLVIVIGQTPAQLAGTQGSAQVTPIASALPGRDLLNPEGLISTPSDTGIPSGGIDLILSVVALAMLARC
jgi:predicted S18 family serine protease